MPERARTDLWEPRGSNPPGPPGPLDGTHAAVNRKILGFCIDCAHAQPCHGLIRKHAMHSCSDGHQIPQPMLGLAAAHAPSILSPDEGPVFQGGAVAKKPTVKPTARRASSTSRCPVPTQPDAITIRGSAEWRSGSRRSPRRSIQAHGDHRSGPGQARGARGVHRTPSRIPSEGSRRRSKEVSTATRDSRSISTTRWSKAGPPETHRFELIDGRIEEKDVKSPQHRTATERTRRELDRLMPAGWHVSQESPVRIPSRASEPEPDLSVVRGSFEDYENRHPGPGDVALVIEIAATSAAKDRGLAIVYASADIPGLLDPRPGQPSARGP